jgi:hypothetical protein
MTCHECELALAGEEGSSAVDDRVLRHVASCVPCRELARELQENSAALQAIAMDDMPVLSGRLTPGLAGVHHTLVRRQFAWLAAVAAMLVIGLISSWMMVSRRSSPVTGPVSPVSPVAPVASVESRQEMPQADVGVRPFATPVRHRVAIRSRRKHETQILQIKMLTDDPDVVIYWQIEN